MPLAASITMTAEFDGGQGPVSVFREILVARRVEQVEDAVAILEGHDEVTTEMPRSRSMPIQSERVWRRLALARNLAGKLDRAAEQQQLFGQRGLARVRVRDDGERAPARDGVGGHGDLRLERRAPFRQARGRGGKLHLF